MSERGLKKKVEDQGSVRREEARRREKAVDKKVGRIMEK